MVNEARLQATEHGLVPDGAGWWVMNARDARWIKRESRGYTVPFTGWTAEEAEGFYHMLGVNLAVLQPGEPLAAYHQETDVEGFLLISGEALILVEGEERPFRQWDYFHCPVGCEHTIIGAGDGSCVMLAMSSRVNMGTDNWGSYTVNEVAQRHNVGVEEETPDAEIAYARWGPSRPTKYAGFLPGDGA